MRRFFFFLCVSVCSLSLCHASAVASEQNQTYDYLIKHAAIYDGRSPRAFEGDIAIKGDRIAEVGNLDQATALKVIDAQGLAAAPGFIDAHTHSDFNPLIYPDLPNKILQGVTTEVVGNCGMSAAPVFGPHARQIRGIWAREGVTLPEKISWITFHDYRSALRAAGMQENFYGLVGHGNLRSAVMGFSPRPASQGEIEDMKKMLAQAMAEGARGISFGLVYLPGIFAARAELVELCHEAARHGGLCSFHMRSEGAELLEAIEEAVSIGEAAQAAVQISHLKAAGKKNWAKIDAAFEIIEAARRRGVRIFADAYPYEASQAELGVVLPDEIYQREDRVAYFRNPLKRQEILSALRDYYEKAAKDWSTVTIAATASAKYAPFQGKTIKEISRTTHREPEEFLIDILGGTSFEVSAFYFSQDPSVVERVVARPYVMIGSDSIADGSGWPHPRTYGSFAKILKDYVREEKIFGLGEAIRKMTSVPADAYGMEGRGEIKAGAFADLVVFDPSAVLDRATYEAPKLFSRGMQWVFVNGRPAVQNGEPSHENAGRFLVT